MIHYSEFFQKSFSQYYQDFEEKQILQLLLIVFFIIVGIGGFLRFKRKQKLSKLTDVRTGNDLVNDMHRELVNNVHRELELRRQQFCQSNGICSSIDKQPSDDNQQSTHFPGCRRYSEKDPVKTLADITTETLKICSM